jgi:hypothetical protein
MRRKKASFVEPIRAFIRDNPELARTIAFEVGAIAGGIVRDLAKNKKRLKHHAKKLPSAALDALPPSLSNALKFLPAPKLQPNKRAQRKRPSQRKAKSAA